MAEAQTSVADWLAATPQLRSLTLDQEAIRIFEHAYQIGLISERKKDSETELNPPISFSTLLIALLLGSDKTSQWFAGRAQENGPKLDAVKSSKKFGELGVEVPPFDPAPRDIKLSTDNQLLTVSARAVLSTAEQWAHRVGGTDIGVRHLVASYVLNPPPNHRQQMRGWTFKEAAWRKEFFEWVAPLYTAEQWTDASHRATPSKVPTFELEKVKAAAIAFPGDEFTNEVLATAAKFHSGRRQEDPGLLRETVFFALIETAEKSNGVRDAILPIWEAVQGVGEKYREQKHSFLKPDSEKETLFLDSDVSPGVLNTLETARELWVATRAENDKELTVGVLHLAGALISRRVDIDDELAALGLDPPELRRKLIAHARDKKEPVEVWREALGEEETLEVGRPVDLNSDEPEAVIRLDDEWKSDPLSIRADVEGFAALLASKSLEPPLSIGLFGPWGSGKTTFMRRLRRAVERREKDAKKLAENETPYVRNVVHVDFNAWHFSEGALTSSLVDTIFRKISAHIKDEVPIAGATWGELRREALETAQRKVKAARDLEAAARKSLGTAQTELCKARSDAADQATKLSAVVEGVWAATRNSLVNSKVVQESKVLDEVGNTVNSAEELQKKLNELRTRPLRLLNNLGLGRSILFAALVLIVPPVVAWVVGWLIEGTMETFAQLLSTMTAFAVTIGAWLGTAAKAVGKVDQAIIEVDARYEQLVETNPAVIGARQALQNAEATLATAEQSMAIARENLLKAEADLANASLPAQTLQLVSNRIEDQTYSKELTTYSLARADLESLSTILRDQRDPRNMDRAPAPAELRPVDRVILYIDDLDRCKPEDVVRVLQLVHMLLAFELFVVVVAVDARWVEQALINNYQWLVRSDATTAPAAATNGHSHPTPTRANVTPQDYLEKIFQISFWLEPMTAARAASYLGSLVRKQPVAASASTETASESAETKIEIDEVEVDYMRALAAYVGPSPRRVKRLVNAYRLIKARLSDTQLETFLRVEGHGSRKPGPYQIVIGLLVIGTGAPSTSVQIFRELSECDPKDELTSVVSRFHAHDHPDWTMAAKVIETLMQTQHTKDVSELRGWARKVGRFLLNSPSADVVAVRPHTPPSEPPAPQTQTASIN